MSEHHADLDIVDGVATITFNRPEAMNAFTDQMRIDLIDYTYRLENDPKVRCVVLRGAGKCFMAGGDVKQMNHDIHHNREAHLAQFEMRVIRTHQIIYQIRRMEKPVVAAVHGAVAGLGLGLALASDLCVARSDAFFTMAYRHIGFTADGGSSYFLPRIVGERKAMEFALLGERCDAKTALDLGLVNWVIEEDRYEDFLNSLIQKLATGPTKALGRVKQLIKSSLQQTWDEQSHREVESIRFAAATSDHAEGVKAFTEKRKPHFIGE
jgi:2-(1,2-epoxy-1,2-dihydrophenyl)acetyl-CoA isomerase